MTFALILFCVTLLLVSLPVILAVYLPEDFWGWAGRVKRAMRDDLARKYGQSKADELLGPPLPYEFFK